MVESRSDPQREKESIMIYDRVDLDVLSFSLLTLLNSVHVLSMKSFYLPLDKLASDIVVVAPCQAADVPGSSGEGEKDS